MNVQDIFNKFKPDLLKIVTEQDIKIFCDRMRGRSYDNISKEYNYTGEQISNIIERTLEVLLQHVKLATNITNEFCQIDKNIDVKKIQIDSIMFTNSRSNANTRIINVLQKNNCKTLGDILQRTVRQWKKEPNLGNATVKLMQNKLAEYGLELKY